MDYLINFCANAQWVFDINQRGKEKLSEYFVIDMDQMDSWAQGQNQAIC